MEGQKQEGNQVTDEAMWARTLARTEIQISLSDLISEDTAPWFSVSVRRTHV